MGTHVLDIPGLPSMVPVARRWVKSFLESHPLLESAALVADELVANAIRHTSSGEPGGVVRVEITDQDTAVRIAVRDNGPRTRPAEDWTAEDAASFGRGLTIIDALAPTWGADQDAGGGRCTWAEVTEKL